MKSLKRLSDTLIRKLAQGRCLHNWRKGLPVNVLYGKGYLYRYRCTACNKITHRWTGHDPISGIIPDRWAEYKKDPLYNVGPSIFEIDS